MSHWVQDLAQLDDGCGRRRARHPGRTAAPGQIATLILPADTAWGKATELPRRACRAPRPVSEDAVKAAAAMLRSGERATLLMGGEALRQPASSLPARLPPGPAAGS